MSGIIKESKSILFIDDEAINLELFPKLISGHLTCFTAQNYLESQEIMVANEIAVVICDYQMPYLNGIEVLRLIKKNYPETRIILMSAYLDVDMCIRALNEVNCNGILTKPFESVALNNLIEAEVKKYNKTKFERTKIDELKRQVDMIPDTTTRQVDGLLELLFYLSETSEITNFSNRFVQVLEGLRSLAILNTEVYFEKGYEQNYKFILQYLSDIEVVANQFDQKYLSLYIYILRSYFYLFTQKFEEATANIQAASSLSSWLDTEKLDPFLKDALDDFPTNITNLKISTVSLLPSAELKIKNLYNVDMGDLVGISESLFQYYKFSRPMISYFIIVKDEFPIYEISASNHNIESSLISGFVIAMSKFLKEVVEETGDIDGIKHENGIILFYNLKGILYVLFSDVDDISHRIALREIAFQTSELLSKIPSGYSTSENENKLINEIVHDLLGNFG